MQTTNLKSFSYLEDGTISHSILEIKETLTTLRSGFYTLEGISEGYSYAPKLSVLNINKFKGGRINYKELQDFDIYFEAFMDKTNREKVESLGYVHKLGLMLHGKQGTGKTVVSSYIAERVVERGGLAINVKTSISGAMATLLSFIKELKRIDDRCIVFIFDECEEMLVNCENTFKNFLDGFDSPSNSVLIFTTNYLDKIPKAIYERPSRIRFVVELKGISDGEIVKKIVRDAIGEELLEQDLKALMGSTMDEIKEYILNKIMNIKDNKKGTKKSIGFN
jgi:SpoVK/Ycf46/Vps4 family AAA+-type ATPase